jgi:hypothetical protein
MTFLNRRREPALEAATVVPTARRITDARLTAFAQR